MARFEDAIRWVVNGGRARRARWANVPEYTQSTPPIAVWRCWRIWQGEYGDIIQGWGGQIGAELPPDEPIRDGTVYCPSDEDRTATDWLLWERGQISPPG